MAFLVSQMFPGTLMLIPLYIIIVQWLGLGSTFTGLVLIYTVTAIPFCVWMMKGYFDTIPKELEESALIDGASQATIFFRIILPLAKPAVAVTALFSFMTGWNEFIQAATFMNREDMYTGAGGAALLRRRLLAAVGVLRGRLDHRRHPGDGALPVPAEISGFRSHGRRSQGLKAHQQGGLRMSKNFWKVGSHAAAAGLLIAGSALAQSGVSFKDPAGDDNGPGNYTYPTDGVYKRGSFDMTAFDVKVNGKKVDFAVTFNTSLEDPWRMGGGFSVQMVFIAIKHRRRGRLQGRPSGHQRHLRRRQRVEQAGDPLAAGARAR